MSDDKGPWLAVRNDCSGATTITDPSVYDFLDGFTILPLSLVLAAEEMLETLVAIEPVFARVIRGTRRSDSILGPIRKQSITVSMKLRELSRHYDQIKAALSAAEGGES